MSLTRLCLPELRFTRAEWSSSTISFYLFSKEGGGKHTLKRFSSFLSPQRKTGSPFIPSPGIKSPSLSQVESKLQEVLAQAKFKRQHLRVLPANLPTVNRFIRRLISVASWEELERTFLSNFIDITLMINYQMCVGSTISLRRIC